MYKFYLGLDTGEGFTLPKIPEEIEVVREGNNETTEVINLGEVNNLNKPKLATIEFECYFPSEDSPLVDTDMLFEPSFYIRKIEKWQKECKPIRVILVGSPLEINQLYSIEGFNKKEVGGEVGDIYYTLSLKEYIRPLAKKVVISNKTNKPAISKPTASPRPTTSKPKPRTHTVKKGDTMWDISKKYLGKGNRYKEIMKLNNMKSAMIYSGTVLKLPSK